MSLLRDEHSLLHFKGFMKEFIIKRSFVVELVENIAQFKQYIQPEAVARRCFIKKLHLKISQNYL